MTQLQDSVIKFASSNILLNHFKINQQVDYLTKRIKLTFQGTERGLDVPRSTNNAQNAPKPAKHLYKSFLYLLVMKKHLNTLKLFNQVRFVKTVPNFL